MNSGSFIVAATAILTIVSVFLGAKYRKWLQRGGFFAIAKRIRILTGWRVEIDKSSFVDLENTYRVLDEAGEMWKNPKHPDKGTLGRKVIKTIEKLPKKHDVEDIFKILVYVFPKKYQFLQDIFGTVASGLALHRIFAVVNVFSGFFLL